MPKKWIAGAIKHPGAFTAQAKKRGMTADQFARAVTANPDQYDDTTVKRANLAMTLKKMRP
jgi:hypothetical protein